jgi:biopolymer transport protein ExbD
MAFSLGGSGGGGGRRRFGRGSSGTLSEINIVPLVDVVLVLLIIFMLTAHVMEFGLEINVPEITQVKDSAEDHPVVSVSRSGKTFLNERPTNLNLIADEVAKRYKNAKKVYVMADRACQWDPIMQVIDVLGKAKFDVMVVAKPYEGGKK